MAADGIWLIDARRFKVIRFIRTGAGTHGFLVSRSGKYLYISNRGEGAISVLDFATSRLVHDWRIRGSGSPDIGGISPDGTVMWWSGRYNGVIYAMSTVNGHLLATIPVGAGPHGVCVFPQPGRYSLGHTGTSAEARDNGHRIVAGLGSRPAHSLAGGLRVLARHTAGSKGSQIH